MTIAVLQPSYLPWLGYLDQIASVDAFVFYDDVQFDRHGWRNRNRIRVDSPTGWAWLTIPVRLDHGLPRICDVRVDARVPWRRKHRAALRGAYGKVADGAFFERHFRALYEETSQTSLAEIAIESVRCCMRGYGITTPLYRSSELGVDGDRNTRLLNICRHFGATTYLSGVAAKAYLDVSRFEAADVAVRWHEYVHPTYPQRFVPFVSHLSAIDALLTLGERSPLI